MAIAPAVYDEGSMLLIENMHQDMVVPRIGIHETQQRMSRGRVYQLVDPWQWEAIFWTCFIQISEVHVGPPLAIQFLD